MEMAVDVARYATKGQIRAPGGDSMPCR